VDREKVIRWGEKGYGGLNMSKDIVKDGYVNGHKVTYVEHECEGEFAYMYGEWIWVKKEPR
jgi:hypothetical protein